MPYFVHPHFPQEPFCLYSSASRVQPSIYRGPLCSGLSAVRSPLSFPLSKNCTDHTHSEAQCPAKNIVSRYYNRFPSTEGIKRCFAYQIDVDSFMSSGLSTKIRRA